MINLLICHDNYICNLQDMYAAVYAALKEELRECSVVIPDACRKISLGGSWSEFQYELFNKGNLNVKYYYSGMHLPINFPSSLFLVVCSIKDRPSGKKEC